MARCSLATPKPADRRPAESGFTLIETLVALAVLSIALIGIIGGVNAYVDSTAGLRTRMAAHWAAMNAIEAARLDPDQLEDRTTDETLGGIPFSIDQTVEETDFPSVMKVTVRAAAEGGDGAGALVVGYVEIPDEDEDGSAAPQ